MSTRPVLAPISTLLLLAAVVLFILAAFASGFPFLPVGLACFAGSFLVP